ncbi:palmitoyltransferase zdhhc24-related [Anaeramoeba ignava]|uniref:Palmitoyltransferase zdhhc24-related n=1 Tax=Anaeramoeba ignava TaxID=1746090 RepID=A0A9Q0LXG2_ANAIG|nr:palmitoyltransferase zdhhc24-related [Anaeramoeba ignava]
MDKIINANLSRKIIPFLWILLIFIIYKPFIIPISSISENYHISRSIFCALFHVLFLMILISFIITAFINPGKPNIKNDIELSKKRTCNVCHVSQPQGTVHSFLLLLFYLFTFSIINILANLFSIFTRNNYEGVIKFLVPSCFSILLSIRFAISSFSILYANLRVLYNDLSSKLNKDLNLDSDLDQNWINYQRKTLLENIKKDPYFVIFLPTIPKISRLNLIKV